MTVHKHRWLLLSIDLTLSSNDLHVWRATLDQPAACVRQLARTLSGDERIRAERFHVEQDRKRFIVCRGILRAILGRYLDIEPTQLEFRYSSKGKPYLAKQSGGNTLQFNLSHSHNLALYAFTRGREVGIDLEHIRAGVACEEIAARFFSPLENEMLQALPATMRLEAFYTCWTRKEAYVKAKGEGLSLPLDQFDVSLTPGEPAVILSTEGNPQEASYWSLQELRPGPGYVATLAVSGHDWQLRCWQWPEESGQCPFSLAAG